MDGFDLAGDDDLRNAIDVAIQAVKNQIATKTDLKVSVADLIKLLQLRRELEGERPRKVNARWIEECENSNEE